MCTYGPAQGFLFNHSYMHGMCGSVSTQYAVMTYDVSMPAEWDADNSQVAMEVGEKIGPVFPLNPDTKKPSITGGFYAGKRRKRDILEMAATRPKHLWALATGLPSGVVVIDADTDEAYAYMEDRFGKPHVKTRCGGHWWFRHPGDGKGISASDIGKGADDLPDGLDRKTDGGYVEIPSEHGTKTWTDGIPNPDDLPVLPENLNNARAGEAGGSIRSTA
jgi:hypothetical protein